MKLQRPIIQVVKTFWSKRSRGGALAQRRNACPESYLLPLECLVSTTRNCAAHFVYWSETNEFQTPVQNRIIPDNRENYFRYGAVSIEWAEKEMIATFDSYGLNPRRFRVDATCNTVLLKEPAVLLAEEQWGCIRYNNRLVNPDSGHWYYEKIVVNAGLFSSPTFSQFTDTRPHQDYTRMATIR